MSSIRRIRRGLALAALAIGCRAAPPADPPSASDRAPAPPDPWAVRLDGIGPLRYGMGVAEVRMALRDTLGPPPPEERCVYLVPASMPVGVRLMIENGKLVRVDVDSAGIRTVGGAEVGMSEADLRSRYRDLEIRPHKYDTTGQYLIYREHPDSSRRLVFETDRRRVLQYRSGVMPPVEYVEGCS
jgi:hypothetical protein